MTNVRHPSDISLNRTARELLDRGAIGMCVLSPDGYHLHVNQAFCDMIARSNEELKTMRWTDLVDPDSLAEARDWREALTRSGRWHAELLMTKPDGSLVPALSIISVIDNHDRQPPYLFKQTIDLTDFKDLQKSLTGVKELTSSVLVALELLGEGLTIIDAPTLLPLYVNEPIIQMTGYTREELENMPGGLISAVTPEQASEIQDRYVRRLRGEDVPSHYEVEVRRKDGTVITVECAVQLIEADPDLLFVIARDVTERKALQDHLQRVDRIEAMGRLAAGTAHDFNNLLTSVLGEADLLVEALQQEPGEVDWTEIRQGVNDLRDTAALGIRIAKQLLNIAAPRGLTIPSVDVTEVIEKIEHMLARVVGSGVRLETDLCEEKCIARIFPDELEQVVLNLILNANDAVAEGGTIQIQTLRVPGESHDQAPDLAETGDVILITVIDDGGGMPPEVVDRMFEPFFTTKGSGRGTGLGLSVVDAIVTRAKGTISVDTEPGRGTAVSVRLPAVS